MVFVEWVCPVSAPPRNGAGPRFVLIMETGKKSGTDRTAREEAAWNGCSTKN